jgi:hypothetical protein
MTESREPGRGSKLLRLQAEDQAVLRVLSDCFDEDMKLIVPASELKERLHELIEEGVKSVAFVRCSSHRDVEQLNENASGDECAVCAVNLESAKCALSRLNRA